MGSPLDPPVKNIPTSLENYPDMGIKVQDVQVTLRRAENGVWYVLNDDGTLGEEFAFGWEGNYA